MEFRAYIACLASYNNGHLHGEWIGLDGLSVDDIQEEISRIISESPTEGAEEYAVHDWEGPGMAEFGEFPDWEEVANYVSEAAQIVKAYTVGALIAYVIWSRCSDLFSYSDFQDRYHGTYDSPEDWAYEFVNECYSLQEPLANYFDYEAYARDARLNGDVAFIYRSGYYHVFWAH